VRIHDRVITARMKIGRVGVIVALGLVTGCPKGGSTKPPAAKRTCDDVGATAARLQVTSALRLAPPRVARRVPPGNWFGQEAPEPEPAPVEAAPLQDVAGVWHDDCVDDGWSQAMIDCFTAATRPDQARACAPVAEDPACVAAADHGAEILASDTGATGDDRAGVVARVRAAILAPRLKRRFSDELLQCLSDPELHESFGICGFGMTGQPDWDALVVSLDAAGFGPKN